MKLFKDIQEKGYSVRQVEEMVKSLNAGEDVQSGRRTIKGSQQLAEQYVPVRDHLANVFQTKVAMTCRAGKGNITIPFATEDELQRILALMERLG